MAQSLLPGNGAMMVELMARSSKPLAVVCYVGGDVEPGYMMAASPDEADAIEMSGKIANILKGFGLVVCRVVPTKRRALRAAALAVVQEAA